MTYVAHDLVVGDASQARLHISDVTSDQPPTPVNDLHDNLCQVRKCQAPTYTLTTLTTLTTSTQQLLAVRTCQLFTLVGYIKAATCISPVYSSRLFSVQQVLFGPPMTDNPGDQMTKFVLCRAESFVGNSRADGRPATRVRLTSATNKSVRPSTNGRMMSVGH